MVSDCPISTQIKLCPLITVFGEPNGIYFFKFLVCSRVQCCRSTKVGESSLQNLSKLRNASAWICLVSIHLLSSVLYAFFPLKILPERFQYVNCLLMFCFETCDQQNCPLGDYRHLCFRWFAMTFFSCVRLLIYAGQGLSKSSLLSIACSRMQSFLQQSWLCSVQAYFNAIIASLFITLGEEQSVVRSRQFVGSIWFFNFCIAKLSFSINFFHWIFKTVIVFDPCWLILHWSRTKSTD